MTRATRFFNWSGGLQPGAPYDRLSPNLRLVRDFISNRFGGYQLGGFNRRPISNTNKWSAHAFGAAIDTSWAGRVGGPGQRFVEEHVLPFLVEYSAELGIQVVHHYAGWGAGPHAGANRWTSERGWYKASIGTGDWIHYETHPDMWHNQVPIEHRLKQQPIPSDLNIEFAPERCVWGLWPLFNSKRVLTEGASGDDVRYLQGVMKNKAGQFQIGTIDGWFGMKTAQAVRNVQRFFTPLAVDGVVGPQTWKVIDWLAGA